MKKYIIGAMITLAFSSQVQAKFYEKDTLTFNAGVANKDNGESEIIYGVSIFQAKGARKFGWAGGADYLKHKRFIDLPSEFHGEEINAKETVLIPNLGFSYGITNELYIVPTLGFTMSTAQATHNFTEVDPDSGEVIELSEEITDTAYGGNIGLDLIYKAKNGLVFGIGGRYSSIGGQTLTQYQAKIGFSFK